MKAQKDFPDLNGGLSLDGHLICEAGICILPHEIRLFHDYLFWLNEFGTAEAAQNKLKKKSIIASRVF